MIDVDPGADVRRRGKIVGFEGKLICCAYAPRAGMDLTPRQLRTRLAALVPTYMLPINWAPFEQLPLNLNGKIDRPKLREHFNELQAAARPATKRSESPTGTEG